MGKWLAAAAVLPLTVATAAHAQMQMRGLTSVDVADVARNRALDLRISQQQGLDRPAALVSGMLVQQSVAPNTAVGLGLANMYSRKKNSSLRIGDPPARSKKPAVSFIMKF